MLKGFYGRDVGKVGFVVPPVLSRLTALTRLAVSVSHIAAVVLQLSGLRSLMLHRLQVSASTCILRRIKLLVVQLVVEKLACVTLLGAADWAVVQHGAAAMDPCAVHKLFPHKLRFMLAVCGATLKLLQSCSRPTVAS